MTYWLDYSAARLTGPIIRDAGYGGAIRYIDDITDKNLVRGKHISKTEYISIVGAGLGLRLVMEVNTSDPDGGYAQGVAYAKRAKAGADYLGYSGVIYFCEDRPTTPSVSNWRAYLQGAISVLGKARVGAYGFYAAMDAARDLVEHFWQAGAKRDLRPFVQLWQDNNTQVTVGGITCDRNDVRPAWYASPVGTVPTADQEDDMAIQAKATCDPVAGGADPTGDNFVSIPCNGKTQLFIGTHFGRRVKVLGCLGVKDSAGSGGTYADIPIANYIDADRPGPIAVPAGVRAVSFRYAADHDFTAWCA